LLHAGVVNHRSKGESGALPAPSRVDVESLLVGVLAGRISRDKADRWAAQWVTAADPQIDDPVVWDALRRLHGVDLTHGQGQPFLHSDEQLEEWLRELRRAG
jgi:hypothetical protein